MPIKNIDAATLKNWIENNEAIVVDVREPAEHQAKKIRGATLVPLSRACFQNKGLDSSAILREMQATIFPEYQDIQEKFCEADLTKEPRSKANEPSDNFILKTGSKVSKEAIPEVNGKKLVIHCHSGKRSQMACQKLISENPDLEVYNLEGGIVGWCDCGFETDGSKKFFLPLDRQVQLIVGISVLFGSLLAHFLNSVFIIIPIFFGAGLVFAGITGFCGLAVFLAQMPWNKGAASNQKSCSL